MIGLFNYIPLCLSILRTIIHLKLADGFGICEVIGKQVSSKIEWKQVFTTWKHFSKDQQNVDQS